MEGDPPIGNEQIAIDFASDLQAFVPLGLLRREFSQDVVALGRELQGAAGAPAYRGPGNEVFLIAQDDGVLTLGMTTGLIRAYETLLIAEDMNGTELARPQVPAGVTQRVEVDHGGGKPDTLTLDGEGQTTRLDVGRAGAIRLRIQPQGGSACRIDFGALPHAASGSAAVPLTAISGTGGPIYFHVPRGTAAFGIGLKTPDHHGRLRVFSPDGTQLLEQAGDYVLGEEFRIEVPQGADDAVWSLSIDKCDDCQLYLIDVPPLLSQKATGVLTAEEALGR